ncbi:golgin subfamily A member 6-like protein 6, partial [Biomphalaria pfeifferi]
TRNKSGEDGLGNTVINPSRQPTRIHPDTQSLDDSFDQWYDKVKNNFDGPESDFCKTLLTVITNKFALSATSQHNTPSMVSINETDIMNERQKAFRKRLQDLDADYSYQLKEKELENQNLLKRLQKQEETMVELQNRLKRQDEAQKRHSEYDDLKIRLCEEKIEDLEEELKQKDDVYETKIAMLEKRLELKITQQDNKKKRRRRKPKNWK